MKYLLPILLFASCCENKEKKMPTVYDQEKSLDGGSTYIKYPYLNDGDSVMHDFNAMPEPIGIRIKSQPTVGKIIKTEITYTCLYNGDTIQIKF